MLGGLGHEVPPTIGTGLGGADQGHIVSLGGARGEDDLGCRSGAEKLGDCASRIFEGAEGLAPGPVIAARRIGEDQTEEGLHRLHNPRIARRRGVVVEINHVGRLCHHRDSTFKRSQLAHEAWIHGSRCKIQGGTQPSVRQGGRVDLASWILYLGGRSGGCILARSACSTRQIGLLFGFAAPRGGWECA